MVGRRKLIIGAGLRIAVVPLSQLGFQFRGDRLLRHRSDDLIDELAILEDQHRGNAADAELLRSERVFVNVQFGNLVSTTGFGAKYSSPFTLYIVNFIFKIL
jgi:hypothetical protein